MRLLLVDDDNALRALLRTTFEAVDVEVDEAANAVEAQERIDAARPDAIVMDVVMPGLDGDGAVRSAEGRALERATSRSCC